MDVPDVWPTVTATDPLQIHLAPLAARLDYLERSLALGMYNVYSAIESLSTVVSLASFTATSDQENTVLPEEEDAIMKVPTEQCLRAEITDLLSKLSAFVWPDRIEIASLIDRLRAMHEEVDVIHCFTSVASVHDDLKAARRNAMQTCDKDQQEELDAMIPIVRNVVACAIVRHTERYPSTNFNALIDVAFNRTVDVTDPNLRSQLGLARKKLWPDEKKEPSSNRPMRRRRRTRNRITQTVDTIDELRPSNSERE